VYIVRSDEGDVYIGEKNNNKEIENLRQFQTACGKRGNASIASSSSLFCGKLINV
jgi:hypothetical protein